MGTWVVINGSPRLNGKCARIIRMLKMSIEQSYPEVNLVEYEVGCMDVSGCNGCEFCKTNDGCIIEDDMTQFIDDLDTAERVFLASPIYFAGAPSQLKAVLDRLQPFFDGRRGSPCQQSVLCRCLWWAMAAIRMVTSLWLLAFGHLWPLRVLLLKKRFPLLGLIVSSVNTWESGVLPDGQAFIFSKRGRNARCS